MAPPSAAGAKGSGADGFGFPHTEARRVALLQALGGEKDSGSTLLQDMCVLVKSISAVLSMHGECPVDLSGSEPATYDLVVHLSNWAFGELRRRFVQIVSPRKVVPPAEAAGAQSRLDQRASSSFLQDFCILLRCCINMLNILEFDFSLSMEKSQILVGMLRELCSPEVVILPLQQRTGNDDSLVTGGEQCFLKESSSSSSFISSILEVFADELLIHQNLRKHLAVTYYTSMETLTAHDYITCDIGIILELVSVHFLISYCEETAFEGLSHLNVYCKVMALESPKLSLTAALALLGAPAISSAPYMLQSHMIFLVSKCVAASRDLKMTAMNCYLSAFEQSVILYTCLASHFLSHHDVTGTKCQSISFVTEHHRIGNDLGLSFDSYTRKVTYDAVNVQSQKLVDQFSKESSVFRSRTKAETITTCITYIQENKHAIQEQWIEEICLILKFIIQKIAGKTGKGQLQLSEEVNWQDVCYGAALMNLISSSLLQIIMVLSENGTKTLRDYDLCRDYMFVSDIINRFMDHTVDQYVASDILAAYSTKWPQTNQMLAHVTSLLFYAIDSRICPLWEGCILVMIAVMNLLVFEEGNLDAVRTMCGCVREISSSQLPASKISLGTSIRSSSIKIASDFQKIQLLQSKKMTAHLSPETSRMDSSSSQTEERGGPPGMSLCSSTRDVDQLSSDKNARCNGEGFLRCVLADCSIPDWDELADFIEAKPERDYAEWLRKRASYNKWKRKKLAVSRRRRKKLLRRILTNSDIDGC